MARGKKSQPGSGDPSGGVPPDSVEAGTGQPKKGTKADLAVQIAELQRNAESGLRQIEASIALDRYSDRNRNLLEKYEPEHLAEFDQLKEERETVLQELRTTYESLVAELEKPTITKANLERLLGQWGEFIERITQPLSDEQAGEPLREMISGLREREEDTELLTEIKRIEDEMGRLYFRILNEQRPALKETPDDFKKKTFSAVGGNTTSIAALVGRASAALDAVRNYFDHREDPRALEARAEAARAASAEIATTSDILQEIINTLPDAYPHYNEARLYNARLNQENLYEDARDMLEHGYQRPEQDFTLEALAKEAEAHDLVREAAGLRQELQGRVAQLKFSDRKDEPLSEMIKANIELFEESSRQSYNLVEEGRALPRAELGVVVPETITEQDWILLRDDALNAWKSACAVQRALKSVVSESTNQALPSDIRFTENGLQNLWTALRQAETLSLENNLPAAYRYALLGYNGFVNEVSPNLWHVIRVATEQGLITQEQVAVIDIPGLQSILEKASSYGIAASESARASFISLTPSVSDALQAPTLEAAAQQPAPPAPPASGAAASQVGTVDIVPPPPLSPPPAGGPQGGPVSPAGPPPAPRGPDIPPPPPPPPTPPAGGPPRPPAGPPPQGPQGPDAQQPQPARPTVARTGPLRDAPASFWRHERQPVGRFSDQVRRWFGGIREGLRNALDWVGAGFNTQLVNWHERNVEAYGGDVEEARQQVEEHRERISGVGGIDERLREQDVSGGERADLLRERNDEVRGMNRAQRELDRALARLENCRARLTPYFEQRHQICADAKLRMEQFTGEREARYNAAVVRAKLVDDELSQWTGDRNLWQAKILEWRTEAATERGRRRTELHRQIREAEREIRVANREIPPRRRELARLQGGISSLTPHITYWTRVKDEFTRVTREVPIDQGQFGGREAAALQTARHPFGRTPTTPDTFPPAPGAPPGGGPAAGGGGGGQAGPDGAPGAGPDQGPQQPEATDAHIFVTPRAIAAEVFRLYGAGRIGVATPEGMETLMKEFIAETPRFAHGPDAGMQLSRLTEFFGEFNVFLRGRDFGTIGGAQMRTLRQHLREMGGVGGGVAAADRQPVAGAPAAGEAVQAAGPLPETVALSEQEQTWLNEQIRHVVGNRTDDQCAAIRLAMIDLSYSANPVRDYRGSYQTGVEALQRRALGTLETQIRTGDYFFGLPEAERSQLLITAHSLGRELTQWALDNHLNAWGRNDRWYFVAMFKDLLNDALAGGGVQIENPQSGKPVIRNIAELRATEVGRALGNAFDNIPGMSEGQLLRILETCYFDASPVGNSSEAAQLRQRLTVQRMKKYFVEENAERGKTYPEVHPTNQFPRALRDFVSGYMTEITVRLGGGIESIMPYFLRIDYALAAMDPNHPTEEQNRKAARAYLDFKKWAIDTGQLQGFQAVRAYARVEATLGIATETPPQHPDTPPPPGTPPGPAGTSPDQGAPQPDAGATEPDITADDANFLNERIRGAFAFKTNEELAAIRDALVFITEKNPAHGYRQRVERARVRREDIQRVDDHLRDSIRLSEFYTRLSEDDKAELGIRSHALASELGGWMRSHQYPEWTQEQMQKNFINYFLINESRTREDFPPFGDASRLTVTTIGQIPAQPGRSLDSTEAIVNLAERDLIQLLESSNFKMSPLGDTNGAALRRRLSLQSEKLRVVEWLVRKGDPKPAEDFSSTLVKFYQAYEALRASDGSQFGRDNKDFQHRMNALEYALYAVDFSHPTEQQNKRAALAYTELKRWVFQNGGKDEMRSLAGYEDVETRLNAPEIEPEQLPEDATITPEILSRMTSSSESRPSNGHPSWNEDRFIQNQAQRLYAVFDGIGGSDDGEKSSTLAAEMTEERFGNLSQGLTAAEVAREMRDILIEVNDVIFAQSIADKVENYYGSTASVVKLIHEGDQLKAVIGNLGDSRVYRYRDGHLEQITLDDNPELEKKLKPEARALQERLNELMGSPDPADADLVAYRDRRSEVGQSVGSFNPIYPNVSIIHLRPGDKLLVTSDGIHDNLTGAELTAEIARGGMVENIKTNIMTATIARSKQPRSQTNARSKEDDMTLVLIDIPAA